MTSDKTAPKAPSKLWTVPSDAFRTNLRVDSSAKLKGYQDAPENKSNPATSKQRRFRRSLAAGGNNAGRAELAIVRDIFNH